MLVFDTQPPNYRNEIEDFVLIDRFHWTPEYVGTLNYEKREILLGLIQGEADAKELKRTLGQ